MLLQKYREKKEPWEYGLFGKYIVFISINKSRRHSTTTNETPLVEKNRNENVTILSA